MKIAETLKNSYFSVIMRKVRCYLYEIHGVKREWSHPVFCMKKHYCPHCNEILEKTKTETVVNSKFEEAKNYDFSKPGGDGYMMGNIKFIRTAFRCNKCDKTYSIEELLEIEKGIIKV